MSANIRTSHRRGAVIAEAAIVLPIAFLFILAVYDYGRVVMTKQLLDNATRSAARQAVVGTTTLTTAQVQTIVTNALGGQTLQSLDVQVYKANPTTGANIGDWTTATLGDCIAVQVSGKYVPLLSKFSLLPNPVVMNSKAMMVSEAN